ncbi:MAG: universal stress protein [Bacteroidota bacterium]
MKKILFPTDFSYASDNALAYALQLAQDWPAELLVIHSREPSLVKAAAGLGAFQPEQPGESRAPDLLPHTQKLISKLLAPNMPPPPMRYLHVLGDPAAEILLHAEEQQADMIVMGTHGAGAAQADLLGSVTLEVMAKSEVPVLAVPQEATYTSINRIAYATNLGLENKEAVKALLLMAGFLDAEVTCVNVRTTGTFWGAEQRKLYEELYNLSQQTSALKYQVIQGDQLRPVLESFIRDQKPQILAMLAHKRSSAVTFYRESLTAHMSLYLQVPVLAFKSK